MAMTWKERSSWLKQINRINRTREDKKTSELAEQLQMFSENE